MGAAFMADAVFMVATATTVDAAFTVATATTAATDPTAEVLSGPTAVTLTVDAWDTVEPTREAAFGAATAEGTPHLVAATQEHSMEAVDIAAGAFTVAEAVTAEVASTAVAGMAEVVATAAVAGTAAVMEDNRFTLQS